MKAVVGVALLGLTLSHNIKNPVQSENAEELLTWAGVLHAAQHPSPWAVPVSNYDAFIKIANVPAAFPHLVIDAASDSFRVNRQTILNDSENTEELFSLGGALPNIATNCAVDPSAAIAALDSFIVNVRKILNDSENAEELLSLGGVFHTIEHNIAVPVGFVGDAFILDNGENAEELFSFGDTFQDTPINTAVVPQAIPDLRSDSFRVNRQKILNDGESAEELFSLGHVLPIIEKVAPVVAPIVMDAASDVFIFDDGENAEELLSLGGVFHTIEKVVPVVTPIVIDAASDSFSFNGENAEEKNFLSF